MKQPPYCNNGRRKYEAKENQTGKATYSKFNRYDCYNDYLEKYCFVQLLIIILLVSQICVRSQMIGQDDFKFISRFDVPDPKTRDAIIKENPEQLAKAFLNLLTNISKETTIQYLLTLLDDILQVGRTLCKKYKTC